jgi:hypothetical protein
MSPSPRWRQREGFFPVPARSLPAAQRWPASRGRTSAPAGPVRRRWTAAAVCGASRDHSSGSQSVRRHDRHVTAHRLARPPGLGIVRAWWHFVRSERIRLSSSQLVEAMGHRWLGERGGGSKPAPTPHHHRRPPQAPPGLSWRLMPPPPPPAALGGQVPLLCRTSSSAGGAAWLFRPQAGWPAAAAAALASKTHLVLARKATPSPLEPPRERRRPSRPPPRGGTRAG